MIRALALTLALACAAMAQAEPYPAYTSTEVNDFADLLDAQSEARLDAMLTTLRADTGIEMVVVTLPTPRGL